MQINMTRQFTETLLRHYKKWTLGSTNKIFLLWYSACVVNNLNSTMYPNEATWSCLFSAEANAKHLPELSTSFQIQHLLLACSCWSLLVTVWHKTTFSFPGSSLKLLLRAKCTFEWWICRSTNHCKSSSKMGNLKAPGTQTIVGSAVAKALLLHLNSSGRMSIIQLHELCLSPLLIRIRRK